MSEILKMEHLKRLQSALCGTFCSFSENGACVFFPFLSLELLKQSNLSKISFALCSEAFLFTINLGFHQQLTGQFRTKIFALPWSKGTAKNEHFQIKIRLARGIHSECILCFGKQTNIWFKHNLFPNFQTWRSLKTVCLN